MRERTQAHVRTMRTQHVGIIKYCVEERTRERKRDQRGID